VRFPSSFVLRKFPNRPALLSLPSSALLYSLSDEVIVVTDLRIPGATSRIFGVVQGGQGVPRLVSGYHYMARVCPVPRCRYLDVELVASIPADA
jgi:hypothetical protein